MRTIASLGCKILGIYSIIQGLNGSGNVFSVVFISPANQLETARTITLFASFLLPIILGVLLWLLSDKLSVMMVKEDAPSNMGLETKYSDIQRIAFSVLGLYFIGNSLTKLVHILTSLYATVGAQANILRILGSTVVELIIGLAIFFGSRGLAHLLNAKRYKG